MIFAQIKNSIVQNIIVVNDESLIPMLSEGFDEVIRVDQLGQYPGPRWSYDGENFTAPTEEVYEELEE